MAAPARPYLPPRSPEGAGFAGLRPRACSLRRLRFSRSARASRSFRRSASDFPVVSVMAPYIVPNGGAAKRPGRLDRTAMIGYSLPHGSGHFRPPDAAVAQW